jgi:hypothetical protein
LASHIPTTTIVVAQRQTFHDALPRSIKADGHDSLYGSPSMMITA